ncbi:MAG: MATE family efflux transporter [Gammaproteobacteria bacterium]
MQQSNHRQALRLEFSTLIRLALPIVVAQFAQTANGFVDTIMAGRLGPQDLAAVAVGASIWVPVFLFIVGVMQGVTPFVAQHHGADERSHTGDVVRQGLWLALPLGLLGFVALRSVEPVLVLMEVQADLRPLVVAYLDALSWGIPAVTLFLALRCMTEGMSHTRPVMVVSLLGLALNIPANYVFMYGELGLPALGGIGCGWATALVMWVMLALLGGYCLLAPHCQSTGWHERLSPPHLPTLGRLIRLGLPIGMAIFIEVSLFCVIALFIASIGTQVVAGHQIALNVASMVFMIPLSLSLALTVRVGFNLGRRNAAGIRHSLIAGMCLIVAFAVINSSLMVLLREQIVGVYTQDLSVIALASTLLVFAAIFQLSDGLQVGANGVLRGLQDTAIPMLLTVVAYWCVGLPVGYVLGLTDWITPAMGAQGFWIGLVAGLTVAALLLNLRVRQRLSRVRQQLA